MTGDALTNEIVRMIQREVGRAASLLLGTVAAVDVPTQSATVTLPAGNVSAVRWIASYTPAPGDFVVVTRIQGQWVILGALSLDLAAPAARVYTTQTWVPIATRQGAQVGAVEANLWQWWEGVDWVSLEGVRERVYGSMRRRRPLPDPGAGWASFAVWPSAADVIPSGATVTAARFSLTRSAMQLAPALISPRLVPLSPAMLPVPDGNGSVTSALLTTGSEWTPGQVGYGQTASWNLPSVWLTGWLAGTIRGVAMRTSLAIEQSIWAAGAVTVPAGSDRRTLRVIGG